MESAEYFGPEVRALPGKQKHMKSCFFKRLATQRQKHAYICC